mmetsp:Transcript_9199/g.21511  ORF Transcript_9199/g.21511 Transcript_9199/m.21511 type:complete len:230 (+) Transcript_9199:37-726(+)
MCAERNLRFLTWSPLGVLVPHLLLAHSQLVRSHAASTLLLLRHLCRVVLEVLGLVSVAGPLAPHLLLAAVLSHHLVAPLLGLQHALEQAQGLEPNTGVAREFQATAHTLHDCREEAITSRQDLVDEASLLHLFGCLPFRKQDHFCSCGWAHALRKRHSGRDFRYHAEASKRRPEVGSVRRIDDVTQHQCCEALPDGRAVDSNDEGLGEVDPGVVHVDVRPRVGIERVLV